MENLQNCIKNLIKEFAPPIMTKFATRILNSISFGNKVGYTGVYSSFEECREQHRELLSRSGSFNNSAYAEWSLQKTKAYLAQSPEEVWRTREVLKDVEFLIYVSMELGRKGSLRIFDFGGGVGWNYIKCQRYLKNFHIDYTVFDNSEVVRIGRKFFKETNNIHFTDSMPSQNVTKFDIAILSSVLHYIDDYQELLKDITADYQPDLIFLSRLPAGDIPNFVTLQTIPEASFPAHCFNYTELKKFCLSLNYVIEDEWEETESFELYDHRERERKRYTIPFYKGMLLRRIGYDWTRL